MSKPRSLYPPKKEDIMEKQLKIQIITLIHLLMMVIEFFIFAFIITTNIWDVI